MITQKNRLAIWMIACCLMLVVSSNLILATVGNKKLGVQSTVRTIELKKKCLTHKAI
ncbi:MAG: hypothetical protein LBF12_04705 [Christensenellaceae bacterium]|jgi:hypothetical protein|nr:hypothetical protein [Christensenellaceae bacterium]